MTDEEIKVPTEEDVLKVFEQGEAPKAPPRADPAIEAYVKKKWTQPLMIMRTACFRCGKDSPVVFVQPGQVTFGGPTDRGLVDNTASVIQELTKIDWRFELRRAYCPTCKNLGVPT